MALQLYGTNGHKNDTYPTKTTRIECFACGAIGHNRHDCPKKTEIECHLCESRRLKQYECPKKSKMDCSICGEKDHKKNNCPLSIANFKKQQEEILRDNHTSWLKKNIPDTDMKLVNVKQIKKFLDKVSLSKSPNCKLITKFGGIELYVTDKVHFYEEKNSKCPEALLWALRSSDLGEFVWFAEHGTIFLKIIHIETKNDLKSMVKELYQHNIITKIAFSYHQEEYYLVKEIAIMKTTENNDTIIKGTEFIICTAYDKYKNDGSVSSMDIIPIVSEISFVYGEK
jgi:hypothetical protein